MIRSGERSGQAILVTGFGTAVAMWAVGYLGRLPVVLAPSPLVLAGMLACLAAGGFFFGRQTGRVGWPAALAGLVTGAINMLVLGSLLMGSAPDQVVPSALWWIPGSILVSMALVAIGAGAGTRSAGKPTTQIAWPSALAVVAVVATTLLLAAGGLVTSAEAGMAVYDWPNSFGYNMFLYPLSRMTGGIYYEHAHRLFGALVGLTTMVLAIFLHRVDSRGTVRTLGWTALAMVVVQGILGGVRVTADSLALAMIHGIFGQIFFVTLVALAVFTSATWRGKVEPLQRDSAETDRTLGVILLLALLSQLVLGAAQRHFQEFLLVHVSVGVAVVAPLAILFGIRSWGLNLNHRLLQRLGLLLVGGVSVQLLLGLGAWIVTRGGSVGGPPSGYNLAFATAHQWFGAALLATSVMLLCWTHRYLSEPLPEPATD